jgi:hypothetical protein
MEIRDPRAWDTFKKVNENSPFGSAILDYAQRWAELMEAEMASGARLEEIAERTSKEADDPNDDITGAMHGAAVGVLAKCWVHGKSLRRWHWRRNNVPLGERLLSFLKR